MKRMPIVLWLMALNQPTSPADRARSVRRRPRRGGRRNRLRRGRHGVRHCRLARYDDQVLQLLGGSCTAGMLTPGLMPLRIRDPARQFSGVFGNAPDGDRPAVGEVAEVGRAPRAGRCARMAWHITQVADMKTSGRAPAASVGSAAGLPLRCGQARIAPRFGDDDERHPGVLEAAELGALAAVRTLAFRLESRARSHAPGGGLSCLTVGSPESCESRRPIAA